MSPTIITTFFVPITNYNSTELNDTKPLPLERDEHLATIKQSVLLSIFILTITGNFLVLMGILLMKKKMTRMYYFIAHLAIADFTTAFFQVLAQYAWELTFTFRGGYFWCKFVKYTQILGPYSSSFILVMTVLDRYQAICNPLSNYFCTPQRTKKLMAAAWTLAFACCLPQLYIFSYMEVSDGVFDCWATFAPGWGEKAYVTWYCVSVFIIPLIILVVANTCISRVIWLNCSDKSDTENVEQQETEKVLEVIDEERISFETFHHSVTNHNVELTVAGTPENEIQLLPEQNLLRRKVLTTSFSDGDNDNESIKNVVVAKKENSLLALPITLIAKKKIVKTIAVLATPILIFAQGPRTNSVKGISRAKIKTVQMTVTVIICNICCSLPFITALLWSVYDPYAKGRAFYNGRTFAVVTLLASLNSCANPWIILAFNPNILRNFLKGSCGRICRLCRHR